MCHIYKKKDILATMLSDHRTEKERQPMTFSVDAVGDERKKKHI